MQKPDVVRLTFDQNPAVSEATQNMANGDKIKMDFHLTLKDRDQEGANFNIEAAVPDGFELAPDAEDPGQVHMASTNEALMTPVAMMVRKKKSAEPASAA